MAVNMLTEDDLKNIIKKNDGKVLVDFYASWCGPCKMLSPVIEEIAKENTDCIIGKIDVDEEPELAQEYRVASVPTVMVFDKGEVVARRSGVMSKKEVLDLLN